MPAPEIYNFDLETSSPVNLNTDGSDAYTRDPRTRALMASYHPVSQPDRPRLWLEGDPVPQEIIDHIAAGGQFAGWNVAGFDRLVWKRKLVVHWGWPEVSDDAWVDSMHRAAAANMPRSLDGCAKFLGLDFKEDLKDKNRIRKITNSEKTIIPYRICEILRGQIPVAASKKEAKKRAATGECIIAPELLADLQWLAARCAQDTLLEGAVLARLPPWPEVEPWVRMPYVDRRINDRGIMIDRELVAGMIRAAASETSRIGGLMNKVTFGKVESTSTVEQLKGWLASRGVPVPRAADFDKNPEDTVEPQTEDDLQEVTKAKTRKSEWILRKSDVADLLARPDLPEDCRLALLYRAEASKVSIRKLETMLRRADPVSSRLFGTMSLGGAQQTMRWASPGVNLYNTVRDVYGNPDEIAADNGLSTKKPEHKEQIKYLQEVALWTAIEAGRRGDPEHIRSLYETEKKDAQDRPYTHGVLTWISRMTRRTLCVPEGYTMPNGDFSQIEARITDWFAQQLDMLQAFASGQDVYTIKATGIYKQPIEQITKTRRQAGKVSKLANGFGGGPKALIAMGYNYGLLVDFDEATQIVRGFRDSSPQLVQYWYATDDAAANAVRYPGREFPVPPVGLASYFMDPSGADCLCCRLPSGRWLRYWKPRLTQEYWDNGRAKDRLSLSGLAIKGKQVFRRSLYHTILVENKVQAAAADMLAHGLDNAERNGLDILLHVYDSIAAEANSNHAQESCDLLEACMLDQRQWTYGLPIAADVDYSSRFG